MRKKFLSAFMLGLLALGTTSTVTSCKDYDDDISGLKSDINAVAGNLEALKSDLTAQIASVNTKIDNLKTELQAAIDKKADKETVQALADNLANNYYTKAQIDEKLKEVNDAIANLEKKHDADIVALTGKLDDEVAARIKADDELKIYIDAADKNLQDQIDILKAIKADERLKYLEEMLKDYPEVWAQVYANQAAIEALEKDVEDLKAEVAKCATKEELKEAMQGLQSKIDAVNGRVDALVVCVTKRPTSIYFCPTTYVNGVEAINFAALKYQDWNNGAGKDVPNNYLADLWPVTAPTNRIDDGSTTAVYYLNPSGVDENSIKDGLAGLSFISHKAENILTEVAARADEAPVKVLAEKSTLEAGVLTLKLKKNTTEPFTFLSTVEPGKKYADNFYVVSLKAPLSEEVKTTSEKGQDINVYSDWARLTETVTIPRIHNNIDTWAFVEGDRAIEGPYSHFYAFSEIYTMYNKEWAGVKYDGNGALHFTGYNRQYVDELNKVSVAYNQSLDLKPLVTVCDNEGNIVDWEAYGLSFEFNKLESFNILDQNQTTTYTNQQKYISIEDGVVTPQSVSGMKDNRDAMDKTPVIQIVLRDKANNAVVDVRYIVLQIVEKVVEPQDIYAADGNDTFDCGNYYVYTLTSEDMNKIAEKLGIEGLNSGVELQSLYTFDMNLYAEDGTTIIGDVQTKAHGGEVKQAQNVVATFNASNFVLDDELYYGGKKTVTGYVHMKNLYGQWVYSIKVNMTVYFAESRQNGYKKGIEKVANYWEPSKAHTGDDAADWEYVIANPTLRSNLDDADTDYDLTGYSDTQILYNIINAYHKNGSSEGLCADEIVSNLVAHDLDEAWFEIDQDRLAEVTMDEHFVIEEAKVASHAFCGHGDEPIQILWHQVGATKIKAAILYKKCGQIQLWEEGTFGKSGLPTVWSKYFVDYCPQATGENVDEKGNPTHVDTWINKADLGKGFTAAQESSIHNALPIKLQAKQCEHIATVDKFLVRFEKPLNYKWLNKVITIQDQMDGGSGATTQWSQWFNLEEAFGRFRVIVGGTPDSAAEALKSWYGVPCALVSTPNYVYPYIKIATVGTINNVVVDAVYNGKKLSEYKDQAGGIKYTLTYTYDATLSKNFNANNVKFTFYNNSGNAITEDMDIYVPVTIETKWHVWKENIKVVIKQTKVTAKGNK